MPLNNINRFVLLVLILIAVAVFTMIFFFYPRQTLPAKVLEIIVPTATPTITMVPTPTKELPFGMYTAPKIPKKDFYRIALVGDSMTHALGIFGGKLSEYLNTLYLSSPDHQRIVIDNYAIGSTNILDLQKQMTTKLTDGNVDLPPLLSANPDLILIESFGYNPLSQLGLVEGQKKQTQVLEETLKSLTSKEPNMAIIFVATIAPNKETYALEEDPGIPLANRTMLAEERMDYIKNHIAYAKAHTIPLIDIYDKSLTPTGDGNILYINPNDHIHPSFVGLDFIDHEIANYIYDSQILPR